jgi:di/tricarboxylate transporter
MNPALSWLQWFAISIPVSGISIIAIWAFLHVNYKWETDLAIPKMRKNTDTLTKTHWFVLAISGLTIALWCMEKSLEGWVGDMGIIAVIPLLAFFGTGILSKVSKRIWSVSALTESDAGRLPQFSLEYCIPRDGGDRTWEGHPFIRFAG